MCQVHYRILSLGQPFTISTTDVRTLKLEVGGNRSHVHALTRLEKHPNSNWNMRSFRAPEAIMVCNHYAAVVLLQMSPLRLDKVRLPEVTVGCPSSQGTPVSTSWPHCLFSSSPPCRSGNWAEFRPFWEEQGGGNSTAGRTARKKVLIFFLIQDPKENIFFELMNFIFQRS